MPLRYIRRLPSGQLLGLWELGEPFEFFLARMPASYHHDESASAYRMGAQALPVRRQAFYASRYLLAHLAAQAGMAIGGLYKKKDRIPRIIGTHTPYVSLSHTAHYVAAVLHPHQSVGIDVEAVSGTAMRLLGRFLQKEEAQVACQSHACATLYWSAKETAYKALKQPALSLKNDLCVRPCAQLGHLAIHHPLAPHPLWIRYLFYRQNVLTYSIPDGAERP